MKAFIRTTLLASLLLVSLSASAAQVSIGIRIAAPPPPRVVAVPISISPSPDFVWVDGYWYPVGHDYKWHCRCSLGSSAS